MISQPSESLFDSDDDDDDFEGGDNQVRKKDEFDIEDEEKFKNIVELDNLRNSDIEAENDSLSL
jgi:hypothetical protein